MKTYKSLDEITMPQTGSVVTVGFFDGAHIGHRQIISRMIEEARARGLQSALVTFDIHPLSLVDPENAPKLLTTTDEKLELFESLGLDIVAVLDFDEKLRAMPAIDFATDTLCGRLGAKVFVAGYDTKFGRGGEGKVEFLKKHGPGLGFEVIEIGAVAHRGVIVSSTAARNALSAGDMEMVAAMLGAPYRVKGPVIRGAGMGAKLGYRTANVQPPPGKLIPRTGIYAAYVRLDGAVYKSALNIGYNPTVRSDLAAPSLEAHILNFDADIYGRTVEIEFIRYIRAEQKFESLDDLVRRIQIDVSIADETLKD